MAPLVQETILSIYNEMLREFEFFFASNQFLISVCFNNHESSCEPIDVY